MWQFWITISACIGATFAGVVTLMEEEQLKKLEEFTRLCESGQVPETGADLNGVIVFCKTSPDKITRTVRHSKEVPFGGGYSHAVFIRPPTLDQTHEVEVHGRLEADKKLLYVVPAPVQNKYFLRVIPGRPKAVKPSVIYLQNGGSKGPVRRREADEDTFADVTAFKEELSEYREATLDSSNIIPSKSDPPVTPETVRVVAAKDVSGNVTSDSVPQEAPERQPVYLVVKKS